MKVTKAQINRAVEVDEENRFDLAGRILAASELLEDEGGNGDALLLHHLAVMVARQGPDYARGWIEGAHHVGGVRMHRAWTEGRRILERRPDECRVCGGPEEDHGILNGYPNKHAFEQKD